MIDSVAKVPQRYDMAKIFALFLLALMVLTSSSFAQVQLFTIVADASLPAADRIMIDEIRGMPTTLSVQVVKIDPRMLAADKGQSGELNLNFASGSFKIALRKLERRSKNDFTWFGNPSERPGDVTLVVRGKRITGTARIGDELYSIEPLRSMFHLVIKRDPKKFPPEESKYKINQLNPITKLDQSRAIDSGKVIRVLVAYTPAVAAVHGDMAGFIRLAIDETNTSYQNSNVNPRLRLSHFYRVKYTEVSEQTDLNNFLGRKDKFMNEVHSRRAKVAADVLILLIRNAIDCGLAAAIMATSDTAFAVVRHDCATGNYTFGHEIGHLQGALHNPENDNSPTPFAYGHGFLNSAGGWRTIMAQNTMPPCCVRLQNWSNPAVTHLGVPMGTVQISDNARVLNETAVTVANFRNAVVEIVPYSPCGMHAPVHHPEKFCTAKKWTYIKSWWVHKSKTCGWAKLDTRHHLHVKCFKPE